MTVYFDMFTLCNILFGGSLYLTESFSCRAMKEGTSQQNNNNIAAPKLVVSGVNCFHTHRNIYPIFCHVVTFRFSCSNTKFNTSFFNPSGSSTTSKWKCTVYHISSSTPIKSLGRGLIRQRIFFMLFIPVIFHCYSPCLCIIATILITDETGFYRSNRFFINFVDFLNPATLPI